jgi:hypothetical protein
MINQYLFDNIINISYAFIIGGLIVVLFTVGTHNQNALIGTISGYAAATCATILLAGLTYTTIITGFKKPQWSDIITTLIPFLILFLIFGFSLALISVFFNNIADNKVSDYYGMFSYISVTFILLQVWIFYSATQQKVFRENGYIDKVTLLKLLLLAIFNMLTLITLGVTLKYFSTDG